ncbi:hypothetical protein [uncultured Clostridium sp.]|uniref:hypothetical protein n=1 Tax=uncultured Clostridium sp. TaxID=59620 RepID=UPI0025F9B0DB|nr:hypothetical protein [uncultured Clostridium sp.]
MPKVHISVYMGIVLEVLSHTQNLPEAILNQEVFPIHLILLQSLATIKPTEALLSLIKTITTKAEDLFFPYQFPYHGDTAAVTTEPAAYWQVFSGVLLNS